MGRMACRVHPDTILTPARKFRCCDYPLFDMQFHLSMSDGSDAFGCLPCDHSEKKSFAAMDLVAVLPHAYVERRFVEDIPPDSILATVTSDFFSSRRRTQRTDHPVLSITRTPIGVKGVPGTAQSLSLDLTDTGFRVLLNFVASSYWDCTEAPEFAEPRARIEREMRRVLVSDAWDPERDANDGTVIRADPTRVSDVLEDLSQDVQRSRPTRDTMQTLVTRVAVVRIAQKANDVQFLERCFVPFVIVRRIATQRWSIMLHDIEEYSERMLKERRPYTWEPLWRHEIQ
jgi:hypothetical protein